ncbi:MAG: 50S ribosome-binding GTPase [Candidatus Lokiarchaeota archaeon]|nr:50S ribosome-binding GTPase [Candidatus Lokiarchaeota archaeon]
MSDKKQKYKECKLVIAGLDNAGKSSALIALRQKYNFYERVKNLKPTIKIDYSSFKFLETYRINIWDMGGQKKFRKIYVSNPIYFSETDYLYFLIDIQDELKFDEVMQYLHDVLNIYRGMDYKNDVVVCFNKHDPKFKNDADFKDRAIMLENLITSQNQDMKFKFFHTSYYDISSISKAISYSLNKLLNLEQISKELKLLVNKFECNHAIIYTESGIVIADHYKETMDTRAFEEIISTKINDDLEFFQRLKDDNVNIDDRVSISEDKTEYVKMFSVSSREGENIFYIEVSMPANMINEIKIELEKFQKILEIAFT